MQLISSILEIGSPYLVKYTVNWLKNTTDSVWWHGIIYAISISFFSFLKIYGFRRATFIVDYNKFRMEMVVYRVIMDKIKKLKTSSLTMAGVGAVTSFITTDVMQVIGSTFFLNAMTTVPLIILAIFGVLWYEFGFIAIVLPIVFVLTSLLQFLGSTVNVKCVFIPRNKEYERLGKGINEALKGVKTVKFNAWESITLQKLMEIRKKTTLLTFYYFLINTFLSYLAQLLPTLTVLIIFWFYLEKNQIELSDAYFMISIVSLVFYAGRMVVVGLNNVGNAIVSLKRIDKFLSLEENTSEIQDPKIEKGIIELKNLTTSWVNKEAAEMYKYKGDKDLLAIKDLDLKFEKGKFYAVVGAVGSGKSSLIYSCLGELEIIKGSVKKNGRVSLSSQNVFLLNDTVKNNILFGKEYNEEKYIKSVVKSGLYEDFLALPAGDSTEIGERGVNLSGGQKQRVSLARALYSESDIYLVDDALSALDAEVGAFVFQEILKEELKNKTRVLVTHALYLLDQVDEVILMKDGKVCLKGSYEEIKNKEEFQEYAKKAEEKLIEEIHEEKYEEIKKKEKEEGDILVSKFRDEAEKKMKLYKEMLSKKEDHEEEKEKEKGKITKKEEKIKRTAGFKTLWRYLKDFSVCLFFIKLIFLIGWVGLTILFQWWCAMWALNTYPDLNSRVIGLYIVLGLLFVSFLLSIVYAFGIKNASNRIYIKLLHSILRRPMSFFDTTPIGTIIGRTVADRVSLDFQLSYFGQYVFFAVVQMLGIFVLVSFSSIIMLFAFIIAFFWFSGVLSKFVKLNAELTKLVQIYKGPVFSNFVEFVNGRSEIKSYENFEILSNKFERNTETRLRTEMHMVLTSSYMYFISEKMSGLMILLSTTSIVLVKIFDLSFLLNVQTLSLALTSVLMLSSWFSYNLYGLNQVVMGMTSLDRIYEWVDTKNIEDVWLKASDPDDEHWPKSGEIRVRNLVMRYRENLERVLKGVNFEIKDKEKIGLVGRTGSGKSSLILALMRIVEIDKPLGNEEEGFIEIDKKKIEKLGLHTLRKNITLIPQDPFLMSGTVKRNIDPFNIFSNKDIINVLKKTGIHESILSTAKRTTQEPEVKKTENKEKVYKEVSKEDEDSIVLNFKIEESGSNLSQGQRQLICIGRALIRKPKILLMDEATANIDNKSDQIIQQLIAKEFNDTTVITIAHRLNTIMHYDRIFFMKEGVIAEIGAPADLLKDENSMFYGLVMEGGKDFFDEMRTIAEK